MSGPPNLQLGMRPALHRAAYQLSPRRLGQSQPPNHRTSREVTVPLLCAEGIEAPRRGCEARLHQTPGLLFCFSRLNYQPFFSLVNAMPTARPGVRRAEAVV